MNYFFIDAETDGLYGAFLSVAVLVADEAGNELESFYGAVRAEKYEPESAWVRENVMPYLKNARVFFDEEAELLEAVWALWMKHRETAFAVSDVMYPVESRLFTRCVLRDLKSREFLAPFPLLDLSTLLVARGIAWNADRNALSGMDIIRHDAMNDVEIMKTIWFRYCQS